MYATRDAERRAELRRLFTHLDRFASEAADNYITFLAALLVVVVWAPGGPSVAFSQVWQLVINASTTSRWRSTSTWSD
jgi:low affinity Fe/Cu permease